MKRLMTLLGMSLLATISLAQVDPGRTVATVNGEEIKGEEYYRRMEFLPSVGKMMGNSFAQFPPGFLTIEQLITEKLVFQLARKKGVYPTDAEVAQEIRYMMEDDPKLEENWTSSGRTKEDLNYQVRYSLAQFKILSFGINITDQEVEKHYNDNPTLYTTPKRVKLRVIAVQNDQQAAAVDAALRSGKKFDEVAREHSQDVTRTSGGDFGLVPVTALPANVQTAIEAIKTGEATAWLEISGNKAKFLKEQVLGAEKAKLDDRLKRNIRRRLMSDQGRVKNDIQKEMSDLRKSSNIDIKQKEFAEAYKKFIDAFLKDQGQGG